MFYLLLLIRSCCIFNGIGRCVNYMTTFGLYIVSKNKMTSVEYTFLNTYYIHKTGGRFFYHMIRNCCILHQETLPAGISVLRCLLPEFWKCFHSLETLPRTLCICRGEYLHFHKKYPLSHGSNIHFSLHLQFSGINSKITLLISNKPFKNVSTLLGILNQTKVSEPSFLQKYFLWLTG